jgi:hypothetical protein
MRPATDELAQVPPARCRPAVRRLAVGLAGRNEHVDRAVYCVGHLGDLVRRHVGDGGRFGLEVVYVDEGEHLLGTAGALRLAFDQGMLDATFIALYGDSYLAAPPRGAVEAEYAKRDAPVLMTVYRDPGSPRAIPTPCSEDGMVTRYEKGLAHPPPEMRFVDYGLSVWQSAGDRHDGAGRRRGGPGCPVFAALSRSGRVGRIRGPSTGSTRSDSPEGRRDLDAYLRLPGPTRRESRLGTSPSR